MTRKYLTDRETLALMRRQGWKCSCGCGFPVYPGGLFEREHTLPCALGNSGKPDAIMAPHCHLAKTKEDVRKIRKADRQGKAHRGEKKRKGRPLKGRGFQGHRKFDGTPVWRNEQ